ncbi:MAG: sterol desaturase family protein [Planctomycetaceae bacterium]
MARLLGVFVGGLVAFHILEKSLKRPVVAGYETGLRRRGYLSDVISALVNGPMLSAATKIGAVWLVTLVPAWSNTLGTWPWACQFAFFFLANDFGRYWLHRAYHASDLLWRLHRVHHAVVQMDAMSVIRIHIGEAIIKNCVLFLPFEVLGIDPTVILVYSSLDVLKGFWHHANLRTYIGPLNYVFNSAEQHWWHHSVERRGHRSNYGSILSVWDWLYGTAYWPQGEWPDRIGVKGLDNFPETYLEQLVSARHDDSVLAQRIHAESPSAPADASHPSSRPGAAHHSAHTIGRSVPKDDGTATSSREIRRSA